MSEKASNSNVATSIVIFFDLIVSIVVGIKFIPSSIHILLKIGLVFLVFFGAFFIMNITKFGIDLIVISAISLLFTWVINGIVIEPYIEDSIWTWILRICAFLICFLGHLKLTIWDTVIKEKFFE